MDIQAQKQKHLQSKKEVNFISIGEVQKTLLGDVNGDGEVTIDDATAIQKYVADMTEFDDARFSAADVNNDGDLTIDDAILVQKYVAEMITSFV